MAEPSSGKEENSVTKVSSFTRIFRSPARTSSKKSSNPLSRLLRGGKSSKKGGDESGEANNVEGVDSKLVETEKAPSLLEEVKEVVETGIDRVFHREKKDASVELKNDAGISSIGSKDETPSETKEGKLDLAEGLLKAKEGLKEENGDSKEELQTLLKDKSPTIDQVEGKEKKEDNCVSTLAQGLQHLCAPWGSKKDD